MCFILLFQRFLEQSGVRRRPATLSRRSRNVGPDAQVEAELGALRQDLAAERGEAQRLRDVIASFEDKKSSSALTKQLQALRRNVLPTPAARSLWTSLKLGKSVQLYRYSRYQ